jgi:hypothetical protein
MSRIDRTDVGGPSMGAGHAIERAVDVPLHSASVLDLTPGNVVTAPRSD